LVLQSFPVDHVSVLLLEGGQLVQRAECGRLTPRFAAGDTVPLEAGLCARAVQSAKPALDNDVAKLPGYVAAFEETQSEMCLPLVSGGQILGVLALESGSAGAFEAADVQPLESVADICATAIQNVNYVERLRHLAYVDALTGIFNRRFFERRIQEEIDRARRGRRSLAVLMADIDQFKKLNDEFGHLVGDEVLRQVSAALSATLRKADVVCRYGGEEFAILLPETGGENALAVAEKVRRHLETQVFTGVPRPVTISIGVADYPDHGTTRDALVQAADCGLYAAKEAGRNCVRPCADIPTSAKTVQGGDPGSGALNALGGGASG
jgi:diguanylate cyclase (GGDEF)-like protein